jgi:hypothetical protein
MGSKHHYLASSDYDIQEDFFVNCGNCALCSSPKDQIFQRYLCKP